MFENGAAMVNDSVDRLSDGQKACLRLVFDHRTTKEIARALDIAPDTVKQRLVAARRILGVASSIDAARLLVDHEGAPSYPPRAYPPGGVPADGIPGSSLAIDPPQRDTPDRSMEHRMGESLAVYEPPVQPRHRQFGLPLPTRGKPDNDLSLISICLWAGLLAIAIGVVALGLTAVGVTVQDQLSRAL